MQGWLFKKGDVFIVEDLCPQFAMSYGIVFTHMSLRYKIMHV
jgi:hypothetical protein